MRVRPYYVSNVLVLADVLMISMSRSWIFTRQPTTRATQLSWLKIPTLIMLEICMKGLISGQKALLTQAKSQKRTHLWLVEIYGLPRRSFPDSKEAYSNTSA